MRCEYQFAPHGTPSPKLFVCLAHVDGCAFCLKATSRVEPYLNNRERLAGVVYFKAGEVPLFDRDTVIQPDNQFPILHANIARQHAVGTFAIEGQMPEDFQPRLLQAVRSSTTLSPRHQARLLAVIQP